MTSQTDTASGRCLCGAIRYAVHGRAKSSGICHCSSCRLASGASSVGWLVVARSQFTLRSGTLRKFKSSKPVVRGFCAKCGTQLTYENSAFPGEIELTIASLEQPERFAPDHESFLAEKLPWIIANPALRHYEEAEPER